MKSHVTLTLDPLKPKSLCARDTTLLNTVKEFTTTLKRIRGRSQICQESVAADLSQIVLRIIARARQIDSRNVWNGKRELPTTFRPGDADGKSNCGFLDELQVRCMYGNFVGHVILARLSAWHRYGTHSWKYQQYVDKNKASCLGLELVNMMRWITNISNSPAIAQYLLYNNEVRAEAVVRYG